MKREVFLQRLRRYARKNGLGSPEIDRRQGKGSHYIVRLNGQFTTVKSGELDPFDIKRICGQLKIDPTAI